MSHSFKVRTLTVRYVGIFDFEGLYRLMVDWFKKRRYWFHEHTYKYKVPLPTGAELEIKWYAEKNITDYFREKINVEFHIWDYTEVEVLQNGVKKELAKARMDIKITGELILDWQDKFEGSKFKKLVRDFYNYHIIRKKVETIWHDEVHYRDLKLQTLIKEYLDMEAKANEYRDYLGVAK